MEIQDIIIAGDIPATIKNLKQKAVEVPSWEYLEKEYDQTAHPIVSDKSLRPDDKIGANGKKELAAKVTYPAEKIAVRRMAQMALSIPVKRVYDTNVDGKEDALKKEQAKSIEAVYKEVRIDGENVNRMKAYFAACEMMTVWYAIDTRVTHTKYGFPTTFKLRCRSYSPMPEKWSRITQADLYPLFDEYGDMLAMSFEYEYIKGEDKVIYFETYTADKHYKWALDGKEWTEEVNESVVIGKIPAVYLRRPLPIWEGISNNRNEIEFTLSRQSDIIRKNSAPIILLAGETVGEKPIGDKAREVYQLEKGGSLDLKSPAITHESSKFYIDALKQNIDEDLQLPNLSLANIKDLGDIGEGARKTLLTDAHLKVGDESHEINRFLQREEGLIKSLVSRLHTPYTSTINNLGVEHIITPFIQNDELAEIEKMEKATGGKAILSRRTAIAMTNLVKDPDAEIALIREEEQQAAELMRMGDVFESGV